MKLQNVKKTKKSFKGLEYLWTAYALIVISRLKL